jgi:lysophospholipase L1-like esterase
VNDYQDFTERRNKRKNEKKRRRIAVLLTGFVVVTVLAWVIVRVVQQQNDGVLPLSGTLAQSNVVEPNNPDGLQTENGGEWNVPQLLQTTGEGYWLSTDYRMVALPENGRVDMSYFNTVTFVGDSITQGLQMYAEGIPNAHYCAYKSIGPRSVYDGSVWPRLDGEREVPMDALVASQPDNVYILLGANILGNTQDEVLIAYYKEMLGQMKARLHPDVKYYIQSITPVRPDAKFSMDRIRALNNALAQLAQQEGAYFLDLNEPLADDQGFLCEEFGGYDGIHMTQAGYAAWVDYLTTHTAFSPRTPYIPGAAPYSPPVSTPAE